jgi:hypothetical protein
MGREAENRQVIEGKYKGECVKEGYEGGGGGKNGREALKRVIITGP